MKEGTISQLVGEARGSNGGVSCRPRNFLNLCEVGCSLPSSGVFGITRLKIIYIKRSQLALRHDHSTSRTRYALREVNWGYLPICAE